MKHVLIEKSIVHQHTRKSKTGKLHVVKQYSDRRQKRIDFLKEHGYTVSHEKDGHLFLVKKKRAGWKTFSISPEGKRTLHGYKADKDVKVKLPDALAKTQKTLPKRTGVPLAEVDVKGQNAIKESMLELRKKAKSIRSLIKKTPDKTQKMFLRNKIKVIRKKIKKLRKQRKPTNPWVATYGHLNLTRFPLPETKSSEVGVDTSGDINSHAVLTWKDPKSGKMIHSYTREFMKRNAKEKWNRMNRFKPELMDKIRDKSEGLIGSKDAIKAESAAIINIISNTGLRIGNRGLLEKTGNRGVMTLSPKHVSVKGNVVYFDFTGKSYQQNTAQVKSPILADFITKQLKKKKGKDLLFDAEYSDVKKLFRNELKMGALKLKDMRTFVANDIAFKVLKEDKTPPPPLPKSPRQQKKLVKEKLKRVFQKVAAKLNNTAGVAKKSYIHPILIKGWLEDIGASEELLK